MDGGGQLAVGVVGWNREARRPFLATESPSQRRADLGNRGGSGRLGPVLVVLRHRVGRAEDRSAQL
jgi:hypothetical protein